MSEETGVTLGRRALRESQATEAPPMTRRERRQREEAEAQGLAPETASIAVVEPPVQLVPQTPIATTESVTTMPVVEPPPAPPANTPPQPLTRRQLREMEKRGEPTGVVPTVASDSPVVVDEPTPQTGDTIDRLETPAPVTSPVAEPTTEPVEVAPPTPLPPVFDAVDKDPSPALRSLVDADDAHDVRTASALEVGGSSPVTHALILPVAPSVDFSGPVGDTGELLMTGQIPLPRGVTEQGLQGRLELDVDDDIDSFDSVVSADTTTFTSPVRATQAVSSKVGDRQFDMVRRAPWGTASTVLGASAILLVLAAAGLMAVALFTDVLTWPF